MHPAPHFLPWWRHHTEATRQLLDEMNEKARNKEGIAHRRRKTESGRDSEQRQTKRERVMLGQKQQTQGPNEPPYLSFPGFQCDIANNATQPIWTCNHGPATKGNRASTCGLRGLHKTPLSFHAHVVTSKFGGEKNH